MQPFAPIRTPQLSIVGRNQFSDPNRGSKPATEMSKAASSALRIARKIQATSKKSYFVWRVSHFERTIQLNLEIGAWSCVPELQPSVIDLRINLNPVGTQLVDNVFAEITSPFNPKNTWVGPINLASNKPLCLESVIPRVVSVLLDQLNLDSRDDAFLESVNDQLRGLNADKSSPDFLIKNGCIYFQNDSKHRLSRPFESIGFALFDGMQAREFLRVIKVASMTSFSEFDAFSVNVPISFNRWINCMLKTFDSTPHTPLNMSEVNNQFHHRDTDKKNIVSMIKTDISTKKCLI